MIGPLAFHLGLSALDVPESKRRQLLQGVYTVAAGLALLDCTTPWFHPRAIASSWGFPYPLRPGCYFQMICLLCLSVLARRPGSAFWKVPTARPLSGLARHHVKI